MGNIQIVGSNESLRAAIILLQRPFARFHRCCKATICGSDCHCFYCPHFNRYTQSDTPNAFHSWDNSRKYRSARSEWVILTSIALGNKIWEISDKKSIFKKTYKKLKNLKPLKNPEAPEKGWLIEFTAFLLKERHLLFCLYFLYIFLYFYVYFLKDTFVKEISEIYCRVRCMLKRLILT